MTKTQLKRLREKRGLSHGELAEQIGVHRTTVYRWEAGLKPFPRWAQKLLTLMADEPKPITR